MKQILIIAIFLFAVNTIAKDQIIIDSNMTFEQALEGTKAPEEVTGKLELINVEYWGFDGKLHLGQLVSHKDLSGDIKEAFELMKKEKFPVAKCIPIVKYGWDDNKSMADNNTSMFNYRFIAGTKRLSNHSWGRAIDINPFQNPAVYNNGKISPKGAKYTPGAKGTIDGGSKITKFFKSRGWDWGGDWNSLKDYQHFDKED